MLTVRAADAAAVALALALAGCAGDGQAAPASQPSPSAQEEGAVTDPGAFPDEPVLREQFDDPTSGWPDSGYVDGGYRLALEGDREIVTTPAPLTVEPGNAGVFIESEVTLLGGNGRAGLFCRGARDGQTFYALTIGAGGAWAIERYSDGSPEVIDSGTLPEGIVNPPGEPNLLRLICGAGEPGGPASLAVTINATPLITAQDPASLDPGPASHIGAVILGDNAGAFEARYDNVAVWIAE
jgi:hypothetical protein